MDYQIIDNFLPVKEFEEVRDVLMGRHFLWTYSPHVATMDDVSSNYYFVHRFFDEFKHLSDKFQVVAPVFNRLQARALIRCKANLYPNVNRNVQHGFHVDAEYPHRGALFSINTNNGATVLEDGTRIPSLANRILLFDSSRPHSSTACTDEKVRININFNYF